MSSKVYLKSTKFESMGETTYGFRMYDDYEKTYNNCSEAFIEDDLDLLRYAKETEDEDIDGMLYFIVENEEGIEINGTWYDFEQIKEILQ